MPAAPCDRRRRAEQPATAPTQERFLPSSCCVGCGRRAFGGKCPQAIVPKIAVIALAEKACSVCVLTLPSLAIESARAVWLSASGPRPWPPHPIDRASSCSPAWRAGLLMRARTACVRFTVSCCPSVRVRYDAPARCSWPCRLPKKSSPREPPPPARPGELAKGKRSSSTAGFWQAPTFFVASRCP
jgi:hypothetical protein